MYYFKASTCVPSDNKKMLISKMISPHIFAIVDSHTSFTLCQGFGVRNFGRVIVGKFWKLEVRIGHFISDSTTMVLRFIFFIPLSNFVLM